MAGSGRTALYRVFDENGRLLYIGIAGNPDARFGQHSSTKIWWKDVAERKVEWHATREDAEAAERVAIQDERPIWNSQLSPTRGVTFEAQELFERYRLAREESLMLLPHVKQAAAIEMRDKGVTVGQLAKLTGLTDEVFRRIGRANEIERLREPTVGKDAKPKKEGD